MRKIIIVMSLIVITGASCVKEKKPQVLTQKQIKQKVDSIMADRNIDLQQQGEKDLQSRLKIEVKVKADSIVQARLQPPPAKVATPNTAKPAITHQQGIFK